MVRAADDSPEILVACPLAVEASRLRRALRVVSPSASAQARLVVVGPGAACRPALEKLLSREPRTVILAGVAGGLAPLPGLVLAAAADQIVTLEGRSFTPTLRAADGGVTIAGVDEPAGDPDEKRGLHDATGAVLADMESHHFAGLAREASQRYGLEWGVVRGVSDGPEETLPPEVVRWVDARGRTKVSRVLTDLATRPGLARELPRLSARTRAAMFAAAEVLAGLIASRSAGGGVPRAGGAEGAGAGAFTGEVTTPGRGAAELAS